MQKCWKWLESATQFFNAAENFDARHPDGEKSQIFSKLIPQTDYAPNHIETPRGRVGFSSPGW